MKKTLLPTLVVPTLLCTLALAGCGGSQDAAAPASSSSAGSATSAPASSPAAPASSASDAPTTSTAEIKDPCSVINADQIKKLTGVSVKKGTGSDVGGYKLCSWTPSDPSASGSAFFTAQEGKIPSGATLDQAGEQLEKQFDGKSSTITVKGADDARYITGKKSGLSVIDVLAVRGEAVYQVLAASPTSDPADHKDGVVSLAEALIAG